MNSSPSRAPRRSRRDFLEADTPRLGGRFRLPDDRARLGAGALGAVAPSNRITVGDHRHGQPGLQRHQLVPRGRAGADRRRLRRQPREPRLLGGQGRRPRAGQAAGRGALRGRTPRRQVPRLRGLRRLPRDPGPGRHRRRRGLHAGPLARDPGHRRLQGREGHLLPEAALADDRRGPRDELRGQQVGRRLPDGQPAAIRPAVPPRLRAGAQRPDRRPANGPRRHARRAGPTTPRPATTRSPSRSPRASTTTSGSARRPRPPMPRPAATSTSAGSTTTPAARSPTGAATTPTAPSGAWAPR